MSSSEDKVSTKRLILGAVTLLVTLMLMGWALYGDQPLADGGGSHLYQRDGGQTPPPELTAKEIYLAKMEKKAAKQMKQYAKKAALLELDTGNSARGLPKQKQPWKGWNYEYTQARTAVIQRLSKGVNGKPGVTEARHVSVHIVAGGDCTYYTQWQAAGFEGSYLKHNFPQASEGEDVKGSSVFLTRLVAGCEDVSDENKIQRIRRTVMKLHQGAVFMTPKFRAVHNSFDPYNHPAMLKYWAIHIDLKGRFTGGVAEDYVIVADLDAVFLKPISAVPNLKDGLAAPAEFLENFKPLQTVLSKTLSPRHEILCPECPDPKEWAFMRVKTQESAKRHEGGGGGFCFPAEGRADISNGYLKEMGELKSSAGNVFVNPEDLAEGEQNTGAVEGETIVTKPELVNTEDQHEGIRNELRNIPGCAFAGPYVLSKTKVTAVLVAWDKMTQYIRGDGSTSIEKDYWGIEWYTLAMVYAKMGFAPILDTRLAVSHSFQAGVFKGPGGLSFSEQVTERPLMLHYGYRGVGWLEYGKPLQRQTSFEKYEAKHNRPLDDRFHFSKFRVPSDWPSGHASANRLMDCATPLLQQFAVTTPFTALVQKNMNIKSGKVASEEASDWRLNTPADSLEFVAMWLNTQKKGKTTTTVIPTRSDVRSAVLMQNLVLELNEGFTMWKKLHCTLSEVTPVPAAPTPGKNTTLPAPAPTLSVGSGKGRPRTVGHAGLGINLQERLRSMHPGHFVSRFDTTNKWFSFSNETQYLRL